MSDKVSCVRFGGNTFTEEEVDEVLQSVSKVNPVFANVLEGKLVYEYEEA